MEEVEPPKKAKNEYENWRTSHNEKYENYHEPNIEEVQEPRELPPESPRPFKSTAEHRKMNIEEVEEPETTKIHIQNPFRRRSPPPGNYENSHTKRTCKHETT